MNFPDMDHLAPERDRQFMSMGGLCQLLQITVGQLKVLMEDCPVKFSMVLDGIGWLSIEDAETVCRKCRDVCKAIVDAQDKCAAAPNN